MDLPGCVTDDRWNHHCVSVLEGRYVRGCGPTRVCEGSLVGSQGGDFILWVVQPTG